jgi:phosphatidylserine/phosphatidylglycerophosphate/cardiolipin synthase-like enzyme
MSSPQEQLRKVWWAEGDTPVRNNSRVAYFVDGRTVFYSMCLQFLCASKYIYLANWGFTPDIALVRGTDHRAGPDGSAEQEKLRAELRAAGLQEADIQFWCEHDLSLKAVLHYVAQKGVDVKALLWDCPPIAAHYNPQEAYEALTQAGVACVLDDSSLDVRKHPIEAIGHATESLHQKITIVDGTRAYVGGLDPLIENGKDFDRWDTQGHFYASPSRRTPEGTSPHPWHDAHALIEGPAAADVETTFRQRWNEVVKRRAMDEQLAVVEHPPAQALESSTLTQIIRTVPVHTYSFADAGIRGIAQAYGRALSNIEHFVYLENQYFWQRPYRGIDVPFLSADNPEMEFNIRKIAEALQRGASVGIVLPDHPNVGRSLSDSGLGQLHAQAPAAIGEGRLHVFCLASSITQDDGEHYRPIYVHAKVAIIDDVWTTVGSGNLNNRGMLNDLEMNVAALDPTLAYSLRLLLWAEHLGLYNDRELFELERYLGHLRQTPEEGARSAQIFQSLQEKLGNPFTGLRLMAERAQENLQRFRDRQPLQGHLLPYLMAEEAQQQGLEFREEHGWIEEE